MFEKIGGSDKGSVKMGLRNKLMRFMSEYRAVFDHVWSSGVFIHEFGDFVRRDVTKEIGAIASTTSVVYTAKGSVGQTKWTPVPWIAVFDTRITHKATEKEYIVYLLNSETKELYLTFNQAAENKNNKSVRNQLREKAKHIRDAMDLPKNISLDPIVTGNDAYDAGCICSIKYTLNTLPDDDVLIKDLQTFIGIYQKYYNVFYNVEYTNTENIWWPAKEIYSSGISKEKWIELLNDSTVFTESALTMIAEFYTFGGEATCAQLAEYYHKTYNYYLMTSVHLAERVVKSTGCPVINEEKNMQNAKWWPVLYVGKKARKEDKGTFVWRIRDELAEALAEFGIERYLSESKDIIYVGKFDSWEIIDKNTAIKHCDKSFFDYHGSGVPKGICWFFGAEEMALGETKIVKLIYKGRQYQGSIKNESSDQRRVRIFWSTELGNLFDLFKVHDAVATFRKISDDAYEVSVKGGEKEMTIKEKVESIKAYIAARGFNYEGDLIENFYLSLKSKPFVILAGTSGTGKTRLVKLFAEAIGAKMQLVPVRPDWSDSTDLFGYNDLSNNFHPGVIIDFIKQAEWNRSTPHFLCLDEMNLARVEYYLSDFLSIIETRDRKENGEIETDALLDSSYFQTREAREKYGRVYIPENLYIIGTVNMDETTFPFSKKVLDRANTIEFSFVNLMARAVADGQAVAQKLDNSFLKTDYLYLHDCDDQDLINTICFNLEELNQILVKANLHVGYRVRDEISFYIMNNKKSDLLDFDTAFDHEIMQKILPRVQGSSVAIADVLTELFKNFAGDYSKYSSTGSAVYKQMDEYLKNETCKYPNSAKKIVFMMRRYEEDAFTSYWL